MTTVQLTTKSGLSINFEAYDPRNVTWNDVPGFYAFATAGALSYSIKYIGICDSFKSRLAKHERWDEAVRLGANVILAAVQKNALYRSKVEADLIGNFNPPLNVHHRTNGLGAFARVPQTYANQLLALSALPRR